MAVSSAQAHARRRWRLPSGVSRVGLLLLVLTVLVAVLGPLVSPFDPSATIGIPGLGASSGSPLGYDFLGRDVLSRLLSGGRSTLLLGFSATLLTYAVGMTIGLVAGFRRSLVDTVLMRAMDLVLAFPAMLVMLLVVTAFGGSAALLVCAAALVLCPGVARVVRTATTTVVDRSFVEAAVARGESTPAILRNEVLPNIVAPIVADLGVRFGWAIILIASVNYLGLGLQPPTADWGLMIAENRSVISSNPWAVLGPSAMLGVLVVSVNLIGDSLVRRLGRR